MRLCSLIPPNLSATARATYDAHPTPGVFGRRLIIAGCASPSGASPALLLVGELGLVQAWTSPAVFIRKLPRGLPIFEAMWPNSLTVGTDPGESNLARWAKYAHPKDVHVLAAAAAVSADGLVTFNMRLRHCYSPPGVEVARTGDALQRMRAALGGLGLAHQSELPTRDGPPRPED